MATSVHFYEDTLSQVNSALATYVTDVATEVIGAITPVATTLVAIYVMLWGWAMMRGMISEPVLDGANRILRLTLITAVALSMGRYSSFLSDFLWNAPDEMAGYIASGYSDGTKNVQFLDKLMGDMYDLGDAFWKQAVAKGTFGFPDISLAICAISIWAAGVAATGYAAFLLVLSKMALAIILGIGPIFVLLTIFEPTKRFFDSWMGQALNFVFLVMLTAGAIKIVLTILNLYLGVTGTVVADPSVGQALPAIALCLIAALVMMQLPSIASALGGGTAIGTLGAVAWTYDKAKGTVGAMRPTNVRREANKLRADYRIVKGALGSVAGSPGAVYRKITGGTRNRISQG